MSDDPYKVLGVARDASQEDIRKAYRKLAKELHPDLHPGEKDAETRFKQVSAAYILLKDPEMRARYDRGEIDATGAERADQRFYRPYAEADETGRYTSAAGFGDFEDLSDLFSGLFTRGAAGQRAYHAKGRDLRYRLEVDFLDAVNGAKRRITLPDGTALDLTVPPGTDDGSVLRLKGKGGPGIGNGPPGDALIEIGVKPHPFFRREGNDIVMDLPVSLDEAVLGAKVEVPTVSGRVSMTVPKGASSGTVLRLRGKGVKPDTGPAGDQRVILKVVLPSRIDPELESFMAEWRERHKYDPRADLRSS
jgi:DnaJ-class molecular chaperone